MATLTRTLRPLLVAAMMAPAFATAADFVVIVHPSNRTTSLTKAELQRFFLRTTTAWPDGTAARPVDLGRDNPARIAFTREVLGKTMAAITQFWTHSVFSGRAVPPTERKSDRDVVEYVRDNPGAIGYVGAGAATGGVKRVTVAD